MVNTLVTAVVSFASTNIDDIFVLMVLFAQARDRRDVARVVLGQYLGIGCLTALGVAGALGAQLIPSQYIGLLGIVPMALGIRMWVSYKRRGGDGDDDVREDPSLGLLGVALLTMANGADNIGVYIPVFSGFGPGDFALTALVFAVLVAVWCLLGFALVSRPAVKQRIVRYQHVLVPVVLVVLGLSILFG